MIDDRIFSEIKIDVDSRYQIFMFFAIFLRFYFLKGAKISIMRFPL